MDREAKEIIDEIKGALQAYELPYESGRWETFQRQYRDQLNALDSPKEGRLVHLWKYAAAAIVFFVLFFFEVYHIPKKPQQSLQVTSMEYTTPDALPEEKPSNPIREAKTLDIWGMKALQAKPVLQSAGIKVFPEPLQDVVMQYTSGKQAMRSEETFEYADAYVQEARAPQAHAELSESRWRFGLEFNSTFMDNELHLGGGVLAQFALSDQFKLSTGVSYAALTASNNANPIQLTTDVKQTGVESQIKALDIPLSLLYEASKGWYASVGVSALAVLDEQKKYNMEAITLEETIVKDPKSGASMSVFTRVKHQYQEPTKDKDFADRADLNFLNLSIGKRQPIYRNHDLMIEPYVKIPIGGKGNTDLMRSGIKVKLVF